MQRITSSSSSPYSSLNRRPQDTYNPRYSTLLTMNPRYSYEGRDTEEVKLDFEESEESVSAKCDSTIDPGSCFYQVWLGIVSMAVIYNMYFIVARTVFWELENLCPTVWFTLDYICDAIYAADMLIHISTGYIKEGEGILETNKCQILRKYFCSCGFLLDVASIFPTDALYLLIGSTCSTIPCPVIVRVNRILRFHRLREFFYISEVRTMHFLCLRLFEMSLYILLFVHWNACFYFGLSFILGFGVDKWVYPKLEGINAELKHQYVYCTFWSTRMLTSHNAGTPPESDLEHVIVLMEIVIGVFIFASILGNASAILSQKYATRIQFQNKMNSLKQYFSRRKVDRNLRAKVLRWCDYVYRTDQPLDEKTILAHLATELQTQIARDVHKETLNALILFHEANDDILNKIAMKLKLNIYCPGDYICKEGDVGKEMFVKKNGMLRIFSSQNNRIYEKELQETKCFGDLCLLPEGYGSKYGCNRCASVVSVGYSEIFSLSKSDLNEVLNDYPDFRESLITQARYKLMKLGLLSIDSTIPQHATYARPLSIDGRYN